MARELITNIQINEDQIPLRSDFLQQLEGISPDLAEPLYQRFVRKLPNTRSLISYTRFLLDRRDRPEDAEIYFKQALDLDPKSVTRFFARPRIKGQSAIGTCRPFRLCARQAASQEFSGE